MPAGFVPQRSSALLLCPRTEAQRFSVTVFSCPYREAPQFPLQLQHADHSGCHGHAAGTTPLRFLRQVRAVLA